MYDAAFLNHYSILPIASAWVDDSAVVDLLVRASSVKAALLNIDALTSAELERIRTIYPRLTVRDPSIVYWSPIVPVIVSAASSAISILRTMQDRLLPILARRTSVRQSVPNSMNKISKAKLGQLGFPAAIAKLLYEYWRSTGHLLKAYRDLDVHFTAIANHAFIATEAPLAVVVPLPDNPETRSASRLRFEKKLDAGRFLAEQFSAFEELVAAVGFELGETATPYRQNIPFPVYLKTREGEVRTMAVLMGRAGLMGGLAIDQLPDRRLRVVPLNGKAEGQD